jgi:hypothetical protein
MDDGGLFATTCPSVPAENPAAAPMTGRTAFRELPCPRKSGCYNPRMKFIRALWMPLLIGGLGLSFRSVRAGADDPTLGDLAGFQSRAPRSASKVPQFTLKTSEVRWLNLPGGQRFDASALLRRPDGSLLTLNDRGPTLYRIEPLPGTNSADLVPLPGIFTPEQLAAVGLGGGTHLDCEALAQDKRGRIYLAEESHRKILRFDPAKAAVEILQIDWAPVEKYFSKSDPNASFEGVAVGEGRLYVANERSVGRLIVVDLATLQIVDHFQVAPPGITAHDIHYTDLCWFEGELWVLLRESRCVLRVEPKSHRVLAEFDYAEIETAPAHVYAHLLPVGFMEGLSVDRTDIWLVVDNNGYARAKDRTDRRPVLFRCQRPDQK